MIENPNCFKRKCKWFKGVISEIDGDEIAICDAFPGGIPIEISYGNNPHSRPLPGQKNDIVYEREDEKR